MVVSLPGSFHSPALKMRTSAGSWQPEGAILEICCSASSAHGTARTEAQRLGFLLMLPLETSNACWECWCPCQAHFTALLLKCERLQVGGSQKGLAWKAVAQPHLPMALLAQTHREWGSLLILPIEPSNACLEWWCLCQAPFTALLLKCECLQIAGSQKGLAWKAVAQPHLLMALLAQRPRDWGCLLLLPPQTSYVAWEWWCSCQAPFTALLLKCECLHLAGSQKGLPLKAVAQPHLLMAVPAQRHRDWGCLLVLPPQSSKVTWKCWCPCQAPFASLLLKCERLQIPGSQKGLAWKAVAQPHLPMALFA